MWVQVQIFDFPMFEETRQTNAVVCKMWFLANDYNVVLATPGVKLQDLFSTAELADPLQGTRVPDLHEGNANHSQADNDQLLSWSGSHGR